MRDLAILANAERLRQIDPDYREHAIQYSIALGCLRPDEADVIRAMLAAQPESVGAIVS